MNRTFYQFVLSYRGGGKNDEKAVFAEGMFKDLSFPKEETDTTHYHGISKRKQMKKCDQSCLTNYILFIEERVNPDSQ